MQSLLNLVLSWFVSFWNLLGALIIDACVYILNGLLGLFAFLLQGLAIIMPSLNLSPNVMSAFPTPHQAICWLCWIFPVDVLVQCTNFYISLYLLKFLQGPILRFLKIVS